MAQKLSVLEARAARAGFIGSVIEYYDYLVYAFLATVIAANFFPDSSGAVGLLATLAIFGAGYVARPAGAVFFGWLGDRHGRKIALLSTVVLMGVATCLIGLIPTYATLGVGAPILLTLLRLMQGFGAGGELIGATTYVAESAHPSRRGFLLAMAPLGAGTGAAMAPAVVGLVNATASDDALTEWAWRVPFLLSIPLLLLSLWLRIGLEDSPEFKKMVADSTIVRSPLVEVFRSHAPKLVLVIAVALAMNTASFLATTYMNIYLTRDAGLPKATTYWLSAAVLALALCGYIIGGRLVDRIGTRKALLLGLSMCCILAFPTLSVIGSSDSLIVIGLVYAVYTIASNIALTPGYSAIFNAFPGPVRYSGSAFGFNIGAMIGSGFAPYLAGLLATSTGRPTTPSLLVIGAAIIGITAAIPLTSARRAVAVSSSHTGGDEADSAHPPRDNGEPVPASESRR